MLKFIAGNFGRKITFSYLVIFVTAFVAVAFYASRTLQNERLSEVSRSLTTQALLIGRTLPPGLIQSKNRSEIHKMVKSLGEATEARITVIAPEGSFMNARYPAPCGGMAEVKHLLDAVTAGAMGRVQEEIGRAHV